MLAAADAGEVFALLEGGGRGSRDALDALAGVYGAVREPWLVRGLLQYHARSGSARALELLARAPELHARYLLDALHDQLRAAPAARQHALAALAPLVARRPPWLHRLPAHPLARELLRAARAEREPLPLLHALLALAALLPAAPALAGALAPELADALLRPPAAAHALLRPARLALFRALYATHPCTLLDALRAELQAAAPAARDALARDLAPLLSSVRLHPALLTGSRAREADAGRWARLEPHDVLADCRRLSLAPEPAPPAAPCPAPLAPPAAALAPAEPELGSGVHAARAASALRPGAEPWFPLSERCGADSAPHTPLPAEADATEPPEAAVEATPENTPARETRAQFRFPTESGAARAIGRRTETSPAAGEAYSSRLARVALERRAADSPVPFGGAPPASAGLHRPEPRAAGAAPGGAGEPLGAEDREVLELTTAGGEADDAWPERVTPASLPRDPRALWPEAAPEAARRRAGRGPLRPASCPPRAPTARRSVAVQTVDAWPEPYEFLIADFYRSASSEAKNIVDEEEPPASCSPSAALDAYLADLYAGRSRLHAGELAERLAMAHAQLMYERWRHELHAERNRRLLGRCRRARGLELQNQALRERALAARREADELRARLARSPPAAPAAPLAALAAEREVALEARLDAERAARHRAEAALHDAEARRAQDAAELRRMRGESGDVARHMDALARAARAADHRAACVRRLRRELLVLGEREARLAAAVRAAPALAPAPSAAPAPSTAPPVAALRAACARAEAEAEASRAKADAATARAHELEAQLAAREAAAGELRRAARAAGDEAEARLRAVRDKYHALLRVLRAGEARRLERLAEVEAGPGAGAGAGAGAGPAAEPPGLAACGRVRRLLEPEREEPDDE